MRLLALSVKVNLASRLKFLLLMLLIAMATLVFLGVQELSRASTTNLDEALTTDLGAQGSYTVEVSPALGLTRADIVDRVQRALPSFEPMRVLLAGQLPETTPVCPPYEQLLAVPLVVLYDAGGEPAPFDASAGLPTEADLCLAGLVIPQEALRPPTPAEATLFGPGSFFLDAAFADQVRLTSTKPVRYAIGLVSGRSQDETEGVRRAFREAFAADALHAGVELNDALAIGRMDGGPQVRAATDGIRLVYALIGWGVLLVGGLGLLVAELIVLRDRNWFFGLARAVGATRAAVAALIALDIVAVLVAGVALAVGIALAAGPLIEAFGQSAFGTTLRLVRPDALLGLSGGAALMLLLGAAYPAWRATRLDPLDVLERR